MEMYKTIAQWLYDKIVEQNFVDQSTVVYEIAEKFGQEYTYTNKNGNLAIDAKVLKEFRKLKNDTIVWDRSERCWHNKTDADRELERISAESSKLLDLPEFDQPIIDPMDLHIEPVTFEIEPINLKDFESN